jgi:RNA polymerase sigma-70 factor, ECF subfamily
VRLPWPSHDARLQRLAARAASGDRASVVALYRALHPRVSRFVGRRLSTRAEVEDAVASTFHRLLESLPRLDGRRGSVIGYTLAIARSVLREGRLATREALRLEDAPEPESGEADALGVLLRAEEDAIVRSRVAEMPPETRELLALRFADDLGWREIGEILGEDPATLRQRSSRVIRELREALSAPGRELAHE